MPRIVGVDIPKGKKIDTALSYIYGIGRRNAIGILTAAAVDLNKRAKDLTEEEVSKITAIIQKDYKVEGELRRDLADNVRRLMEIGSYRGSRHRRGLPTRGQRTRTNARTRKGPRRTVGGMKRKVEKKV